MAQTIPETIPAKASQGEKLLFEILKTKLPQDFIVWYEPEIKGFYPDFVILGATFGLLILEVKGWYANRIVRLDTQVCDVKYRGRDGNERVKACKTPLRQGHEYYATITDRLEGYSILRRMDGPYKGTLAFPIGVGAVMSNIATNAPGIWISTALSSLGLEFKVVLVLWVEQFADCCNPDAGVAAVAQRQLYVAMTRAQDELHLFAGGYARLIGELRES